ncbi:hypothetical protein AVEN_90472-1, partial [Araneus ventricosus]
CEYELRVTESAVTVTTSDLLPACVADLCKCCFFLLPVLRE